PEAGVTAPSLIRRSPSPGAEVASPSDEAASPGDEAARLLLMGGDEGLLVEFGSVRAEGAAVDDPPPAGDHHPIGLLRAAEDEGGNRIVRAGEGQPVEAEHREVGLPADLDGSDVVSAQSRRRTCGRPVEDPLAGDDVRPVAQALEVE